jgi:hypothetical protein
MMSVGGPLHHTELFLPLPLATSLWFAKSATSWKDIILSQFPQEPAKVSGFNCLGDLSQLQILPSIYDINIARLATQYGISSLIQTYQKLQSTVGCLHDSNSPEHILWKATQRRWLLQALECQSQQLDLCPPESKAPISILLLLELLSLHFSVSIDQLECLAGKEGLDEAQSAYAVVQKWVNSSECRKALWHAGQLLRLIRALPTKAMTEFHATAIYHVGLCLWAYGMMSTEVASDTGSSTKEIEEVMLDGEETLTIQRWIARGSGRPVLSTGEAHKSKNHTHTVSFSSIGKLLQICMRDIRRKYPSCEVLPSATENLCNLLHALEVASTSNS